MIPNPKARDRQRRPRLSSYQYSNVKEQMPLFKKPGFRETRLSRSKRRRANRLHVIAVAEGGVSTWPQGSASIFFEVL